MMALSQFTTCRSICAGAVFPSPRFEPSMAGRKSPKAPVKLFDPIYRSQNLGWMQLLETGILQTRVAFLPFGPKLLKSLKPRPWVLLPQTLGEHLKKRRLAVQSRHLMDWV